MVGTSKLQPGFPASCVLLERARRDTVNFGRGFTNDTSGEMLGSEQLTLKLCLVGGKTTQDPLTKKIAKLKKNSHTVNPHQLQLYNKLNRAILG